MLDLQPFCSTDHLRPYLTKPFSRDGFTWATNGHIILRVPLRAEVLDHDTPLKLAERFRALDGATFFKPKIHLPRPPDEKGPCPACDAVGCDAEGFDCPRCKGYGTLDPEARTSTSIRPKLYALNYIRQIAMLPDIELSVMKAEPVALPLLFRFAGGVGALMGLRSKYD